MSLIYLLYRREMNEGANDGGCTDPIGSQDSQFSVDSVIMDPKTKMHRSPHRAHLENKMRTKGGMANEGGTKGEPITSLEITIMAS